MRSPGVIAVAVACIAFAACSGKSSVNGASSGTPRSTADTPASCRDFQAAQTVTEACAALGGGCPQTLHGYLATGHVSPQSYALIGCGLTEIDDSDASAGTTTAYAFDAGGALVGIGRFYEDGRGACGTTSDEFGTLVGSCGSVRTCYIPKDASETGNVCGCDCPDPPPADGVFTTTAACVYLPHPIHDCESALGDELARYVDEGLTLTYGCGFVIARDGAELECIYDATGALAGSHRVDFDATCPGVTAYRAGTAYVSCGAEQSCRWGPGPGTTLSDANLAPCGDTPPAAGGSSQCNAWQDETDLAASCALVGDCPANEQSYLDGLADPTSVKAVLGCGLTWFTPAGGNVLGGAAFAFDQGGALVGYDFWNDSPFGPCADQLTNEYARGDDLSTCASVESCTPHDAGVPPCR